MASFTDQMRVKYLSGKENLNTKQQTLLNTAKQNIANSQTPKAVTSDIVTNTIEQPIKTQAYSPPPPQQIKQPVTVKAPSGVMTGTSPTQQMTAPIQQPIAQPIQQTTNQAPNIPLRQALESQGVKVDWNPTTRQVTANGVPIDTSTMNLVNGSYQASQQDINNIMAQFQQQAGTTSPTGATTPTGTVPLRQTFEQQGLQVGYNPETKQVMVDGLPIDTSGMTLVNGSYQATPEALQNITTQVQQTNVPLRQTLEARGIEVGYDPETKQVTANGVPIDTSKMKLVNGSYQATQQDIDNIIKQTPKNVQMVEQDYLAGMEDIAAKYEEQMQGLQTGLANYKPAYDQEILSTLRSIYGDPFKYDPNSDLGLQEAQKYAERQLIDTMNSRGILNSTITRDEYGQILSRLVPEYEKIAFERYQQNINNQLKKIDVLQSLSKDDYDRYSDYIDMAMTNTKNISAMSMDMMKENYNIMYNQVYKRPMEERQQALQEKQNLINMAYDKLQNQGYVDNEIAGITGLRPGQLSMEVSNELGDYQLSLEEQQALLNNEMTVNDIRHRAKLQEIEAKREEAQTIQSAKSYIDQVESYLNTLTAEEALQVWNSNYNKIIEDLGDGYVHVTEDTARINESLVKRYSDEQKEKQKSELDRQKLGLEQQKLGLAQQRLGLDRQKESRMASESKSKKSTTSEEYINDFGTSYAKFKALSVKDAKKALQDPQNVQDLTNLLGTKGYQDLYNAVLNESIAQGYSAPYGKKLAKPTKSKL